MSGKLYVIGTGPGDPAQMTLETTTAISEAEIFFGYGPYLDRLTLRPEQRRHPSDNRKELVRATTALRLAAKGSIVCVVSGGDPGVFAMATAVCEAIDTGLPEWRSVDLVVLPGITAMLALAASIGAPLGHDFCAISLSDNLKPWKVVAMRLRLAAEAGFVITLYNPISKSRPWQLSKALTLFCEILPITTLIIFGRAIGRPNEAIRLETLESARADMADMATCIIVGSRQTQRVIRPGRPDLVYTPRSMPEETK